jgi:DNA-binding transcriptional LysR family regulator
MLKLESVAAFVSIVEAGSIAGAARRLGISKSVVSERLSELERVLGTRFVQPTTRRLSLTQDGLLMRDAAVAGLGIALLGTFLLEDPLKKQTLKVIDVGAEPEGATVFVAYPEDLRSSEKIRTLTTWLRQAFGDPPYWDLKAIGRYLGYLNRGGGVGKS